MIKHAIVWRKQFAIEEILSKDLGATSKLEILVFVHDQDKEEQLVFYNVYGEFQSNDLYSKEFGGEEKSSKFLK